MIRMDFGPDDEDAYEARREELITDFGAWVEELPVSADPEDLGLLLDWKWGYGDGCLDHWHTAGLREFLLGWCPRKLSIPPSLSHKIPSTVTLAMSFLAARGLLAAESDPVDKLTEYATGLQTEFMEAMADPGNYGLAKSVFGELDIDDPLSLDEDELQDAMDAFNALPMEQRRAVTDGANRGEAEELPVLGPVQLPSDESLRASAEATPVLAAFAALADYLAAPGKQLTNNGNLKIADARALIEILDTGEVYEEEIGDQVFRKRSSTDFRELDHWQWWAREAGAIAQRGNKLVGVKAWHKRLRKDPVAEVRRAFDVLLDFGPLQSYRPRFVTQVVQTLDWSLEPLFGRLLQQQGPADYDELVETWTGILLGAGVDELYPGELARTFDTLFTVLERAGVVSQEGAIRDADHPLLARRSGGTVRLTPVGIVLAVDLVRAEGATVEIQARPEDLDATGLVALADDTGLEPEQWWELAISWLDLQPDWASAASNILTRIADRDLLLLVIALSESPEPVHDRLAPVLEEFAFRTDPPPGGLGSAAIIWLLRNDPLEAGDIEPEMVLNALLAIGGVFAEDGDISFLAAMLGGVDEQLGFIAAAGHQMPPRVVGLLEAIGREHPDKRVAKAARKELFRVRSKLAGAS